MRKVMQAAKRVLVFAANEIYERLCPFIKWTAEYPVIWVFILLPWVFGAELMGDGLGLPLLFRNDSVLRQLFTGAMLGFLLAHVCYIGWLLSQGRGIGPDEIYERRAYPVYAMLPLGVLYTVGFFAADPHPRTVTLLAAMWAAIAACLFAWRSNRVEVLEKNVAACLFLRGGLLRIWLEQYRRGRSLVTILGIVAHWLEPDRLEALGQVDRARGQAHQDHQVAALHALVFLFFYALLHAGADILPAAAAISVLLTLAAAAWGYARFFARRRFVVYLVAFGTFVSAQVFWLGPRHTLDGLSEAEAVALSGVYPPDEPPPPATATISSAKPLLDDRTTLNRWRADFSADDKPQLVVVATSGGGIRAAAWTVHVLQKLEAELPDFTRHVRLVTGASGGMVGASYWVSTRPPVVDERCANKQSSEADLLRDMAKDSLDPVANHFALIRPTDRGRELERAWEHHTDGCMAVRFASLREGEADGTRPSLVFSPAVVEDGRRMLASHLDLEPLTRARENGRTGSRSAYELFRLFPDAPLRVSELARVSATFPYVSPEVRLPTEPVLRLVDAGYYDNYGVNLAVNWIRLHRDWVQENVSGVLLVQIRDGPSNRGQLPSENPSWAADAFSPLTTPLEALLNARTSTAEYRNDEQLAALEHAWKDRSNFFLTVEFELPDHMPLTWRLTEEETQRTRDGMPHRNKAGQLACANEDDDEPACPENLKQLQHLRRWWSQPN